MKILENISLGKLNTFGINVSARYFIEVDSFDSVQSLLEDKTLFSFRSTSNKLVVLGGGSNILFTKNFDGVVVKNVIKGIELLRQDEEYYYVKVGAGEPWHQFVLYCIQNNYSGVENLSLIPGSVGAAPIQNIGAYGVEQKELFYELEAISIHENKKVNFSNAACNFSYRDSVFKRDEKGKFIITSVTFKLFKTPRYNTSYGAINAELEKMGVRNITIAAISQAICNIRRTKLPDPEKIGNAGSFFKNPVVDTHKFESLKKEFPTISAYKDLLGMKVAAGWLIEQCGWKGKKVGNTGTHKDQALVLVNYGNAKGLEILELSDSIIRSVKEKFAIDLEREVVIL
jgi:UDP-N-acetylmuramate dehydrogenase